MRQFLLTLTTVIALFFTATPILAEDFYVAAKHAIAVEFFFRCV
ncbi:hypothetical protein [Streptococcus equi]|nr:hypothetical protein [Streptococcus equi]